MIDDDDDHDTVDIDVDVDVDDDDESLLNLLHDLTVCPPNSWVGRIERQKKSAPLKC